MESGVAIIIPTCDRPELLERAVRSAITQTVDAEVVVVDDGILAPDLGSIPGNITYVKTSRPYSGPSKARNRGVLSCSPMTKFICYLDDDDELLPEYVRLQSSLIDVEHEFGFSVARFEYQDGTSTTDPEPSNKGVKRYYDPNALLKQNIAPISSFIHTTKAWSKIGGWDESLLRLEDWDYWGRMFISCGPPSARQDVTNVIHKGGSVSRSDYNVFAYAMSCHWRDIVEERLRFLSRENRGIIYYGDPLPRIPALTVVASEWQNWSSIIKSVMKLNHEVVLIHDDQRVVRMDFPNHNRWIRTFEPSSVCNTTIKQINYGLILSRSKYVWFGDSYDHNQFLELDHNPDLYVVYSPVGAVCRRSVLERIGGLSESSKSVEEAITEFVERAGKVFVAKEIP